MRPEKGKFYRYISNSLKMTEELIGKIFIVIDVHEVDGITCFDENGCKHFMHDYFTKLEEVCGFNAP